MSASIIHPTQLHDATRYRGAASRRRQRAHSDQARLVPKRLFEGFSSAAEGQLECTPQFIAKTMMMEGRDKNGSARSGPLGALEPGRPGTPLLHSEHQLTVPLAPIFSPRWLLTSLFTILTTTTLTRATTSTSACYTSSPSLISSTPSERSAGALL